MGGALRSLEMISHFFTRGSCAKPPRDAVIGDGKYRGARCRRHSRQQVVSHER